MKIPFRVAVFYILTFTLTAILGGIQQASGIDANKIILPQLSPGLAALIMLVLFRKDKVKLTISIKSTQMLKYVGAVGIPLIVSAILFLIYRQFISHIDIPPVSMISGLILFGGILIGAFGEELGWRGYLQGRLESILSVLIASLSVGILWGLWHVGNYHYGAVYMLFFILSTIAWSVIVAWILRNTGYNVVIAGLFHFTINAGFFILKDAITDLRFMMLNGIVWVIAAAILVTLKRKDFLPAHSKKY
jgi:membrane protease YdiL (CAAX protease family)